MGKDGNRPSVNKNVREALCCLHPPGEYPSKLLHPVKMATIRKPMPVRTGGETGLRNY